MSTGPIIFILLPKTYFDLLFAISNKQMKHHFGDFLDRADGYWTIVPNIARYAYAADSDIAGSGNNCTN
jgi:hypothetical protein